MPVGHKGHALGEGKAVTYPLAIWSLKGKCDYGHGLMSCTGSKKPVEQDGRPHWTTNVKHTRGTKEGLRKYQTHRVSEVRTEGRP